MSDPEKQDQSDKRHAAHIRQLGELLNAAILAAKRDGLSVSFTTTETVSARTTTRTIDDWQFERAQLARLPENP